VVVTSERGFTEAGASPARPRHCDGHVVAAHTPLGVAHSGRRAVRPKPGDVLRSRHLQIPRGRDGGAAHTAQALAHLRSVGGGRFRYAPLDTADPPRGFCRAEDRKSTRLNSSHVAISYAV